MYEDTPILLGPKPKTKSRVSKKLRKVQPRIIPPAESLQSENVNWAAAISHFSCFVVLSLLYSCDGLTKDIGNSRD